ncbi:hypothetical protein D3C84_1108780 [compost metagenome]
MGAAVSSDLGNLENRNDEQAHIAAVLFFRFLHPPTWVGGCNSTQLRINAQRSAFNLSIAALKSCVVIFWLSFDSWLPNTLRTTLATV